MALELFSNNLLGLFGVYGSCFLLLGLAASFLLKAHSARAHQVLLLSMLGTILMPGLYQTAKSLEWGLLTVEPTPSRAVMPLEPASPEVADSVAVSELPITSFTETRLPASNSTPRFSWQSSFAWLWFLLSFTLLTRLMMAFMKTRHLVSHAVSVNDSLLLNVLQRACKKLNIPNTAGLFTHEDIQTPSIWCWGKQAMLLLPNQALSDRQTVKWDGIICHEIAHLKRKDHLVAAFGELFVCLLPWNPLSWIVKRRLTLLSEQACDDWVLACDPEGTGYAESLLDLLPQIQLAFASSVATSKSGVTRRVHRILKDQTGNPKIGLHWTLWSSVIAALAVVGICLAQVRPTPQNTEAIQVSTDRLAQLSESQEYTLDTIVAGLEAAEAQVPSLKYDYSYERVLRINDSGSAKTKEYIQGIFARVSINGCLYLDQKGTVRDIDTGEEQIVPGSQIAFDGKSTSRLLRTLDRSEHMRGIIYSGRDAKLLKLPNTPHVGFIRGYSGIPYSKIISGPGNEVRILGTTKQADGLTVVKLGGTFSNGVGEVTLWICPQRGFLPLKFIAVRTSDNEKMIEYSTSNYVKLADESYYPKKVVIGNDEASASGIIKIFNISIDPLPQEFFRVQMPPKTHVTDHITGTSYLIEDKEKGVNL